MQRSLAENYPQANWFFFANEETQVDYEALSIVLNDYDENEVSIFLLISCNSSMMYGRLWYRFGFLVMH